MEYLLPLSDLPEAKYHGCRVRLVDNNASNNDRKG